MQDAIRLFCYREIKSYCKDKVYIFDQKSTITLQYIKHRLPFCKGHIIPYNWYILGHNALQLYLCFII